MLCDHCYWYTGWCEGETKKDRADRRWNTPHFGLYAVVFHKRFLPRGKPLPPHTLPTPTHPHTRNPSSKSICSKFNVAILLRGVKYGNISNLGGTRGLTHRCGQGTISALISWPHKAQNPPTLPHRHGATLRHRRWNWEIGGEMKHWDIRVNSLAPWPMLGRRSPPPESFPRRSRNDRPPSAVLWPWERWAKTERRRRKRDGSPSLSNDKWTSSWTLWTRALRWNPDFVFW